MEDTHRLMLVILFKHKQPIQVNVQDQKVLLLQMMPIDHHQYRFQLNIGIHDNLNQHLVKTKSKFLNEINHRFLAPPPSHSQSSTMHGSRRQNLSHLYEKVGERFGFFFQ